MLFIVTICPASGVIKALTFLARFPRNPLHSPTLSCKNEQFLFLCFDAMLTGVTLIYLGVWNSDLSCFFPSRGFIFADIGSCHFATPCDVGDTQSLRQVLDSRHTYRRAGNISSGKVPKCVNKLSINLSQGFFIYLHWPSCWKVIFVKVLFVFFSFFCFLSICRVVFVLGRMGMNKQK